MKKLIVSATIAFAAIAVVQAADGLTDSRMVTGPSQQQFVQDTVPQQRRDSSWKNKKKYPDTTQQRHRRDTSAVK